MSRREGSRSFGVAQESTINLIGSTPTPSGPGVKALKGGSLCLYSVMIPPKSQTDENANRRHVAHNALVSSQEHSAVKPRLLLN